MLSCRRVRSRDYCHLTRLYEQLLYGIYLWSGLEARHFMGSCLEAALSKPVEPQADLADPRANVHAQFEGTKEHLVVGAREP